MTFRHSKIQIFGPIIAVKEKSFNKESFCPDTGSEYLFES